VGGRAVAGAGADGLGCIVGVPVSFGGVGAAFSGAVAAGSGLAGGLVGFFTAGRSSQTEHEREAENVEVGRCHSPAS